MLASPPASVLVRGPVGKDGLVYRRTAAEVLGVVYNGILNGNGLFPDRANGAIR